MTPVELPAGPRESRWPATGAVVVALVIQLALPDRLTLGPRLLLPALEALLLLPLMAANPSRLTHTSRDVRFLSLMLIGLVAAANAYSLALLAKYLIAGGRADGRTLIYSAAGIWLTNIAVFGLGYWEVDRGGPSARARDHHAPPDFLFPQMSSPELSHGAWSPSFTDYLYVAVTNATAFSPTDAMPLTRRVKLMMGVQAIVSLITLALVAARAVNILS